MCFLFISFYIPTISSSLASSFSQLTSIIKDPIHEDSLQHTCTSSFDCYNEYVEYCWRCYRASDWYLERCTRYSGINSRVIIAIESIFQPRLLDQISEILLNILVDFQSTCCVMFSPLMRSDQRVTEVSSEPELNISSYAFINSRGTENC